MSKKETYYFPHDYTPTDDPKIMGLLAEYGAVGYGLYWRIVELLHNDPEHQLEKHQYLIVAIAKQMNSAPDFLLQFIEDCVSKFALFSQDNNIITCQRVNRNIEDRQRKTNIAKANGSKGGEARAKQIVATAKQNVAIKGNKRKGKEIKGNDIKKEKELSFSLFWDAYGKKTDREKCLIKFLQLPELDIEKILAVVPYYVASTPEIKFRKNPLTYLNGKCWMDGVATTTPANKPFELTKELDN